MSLEVYANLFFDDVVHWQSIVKVNCLHAIHVQIEQDPNGKNIYTYIRWKNENDSNSTVIIK